MTLKTTHKGPQLRLGAAQIKLLERLCNACAVSGDESEVRAIVLEQVRSYAETARVDALGNVLVTCPGQGTGRRLRVMLAAHMDRLASCSARWGDVSFALTRSGSMSASWSVNRSG
jgi:hypothetical protein